MGAHRYYKGCYCGYFALRRYPPEAAAQYWGRPVKDTFNYIPPGTDCDLYLGSFHSQQEDTLFLILHRTVTTVVHNGDTVMYSAMICGRPYAVLKNDSIVEYCSYPGSIPAAAFADSLRNAVHTLAVDADAGKTLPKVHPNPFTDNLVIENAAGATAAISDLAGRILASYPIHTAKEMRSLGTLPPGVYILRLLNSNGSISAMRILKQ